MFAEYALPAAASVTLHGTCCETRRELRAERGIVYTRCFPPSSAAAASVRPSRSSVAQWQSIRLLTGGLLVRVQPEEPLFASSGETRPDNFLRAVEAVGPGCSRSPLGWQASGGVPETYAAAPVFGRRSRIGASRVHRAERRIERAFSSARDTHRSRTVFLFSRR